MSQGMTEFTISDHLKLGLMPNNGNCPESLVMSCLIHLKEMVSQDCELYIYVDDLESEFGNATHCGARLGEWYTAAKLGRYGMLLC